MGRKSHAELRPELITLAKQLHAAPWCLLTWSRHGVFENYLDLAYMGEPPAEQEENLPPELRGK